VAGVPGIAVALGTVEVQPHIAAGEERTAAEPVVVQPHAAAGDTEAVEPGEVPGTVAEPVAVQPHAAAGDTAVAEPAEASGTAALRKSCKTLYYQTLLVHNYYIS